MIRLQTPLCGGGAILRTAGYSKGLWNARDANWIGVRILRSDTDFLMGLFSDLKANAERLHQMIRTEVPLFSFARPVKDVEAVCKGDSGGRVYTETAGQEASPGCRVRVESLTP